MFWLKISYQSIADYVNFNLFFLVTTAVCWMSLLSYHFLKPWQCFKLLSATNAYMKEFSIEYHLICEFQILKL